MSVVVFGSLNMDLVTRVRRLPKPGETLMGTAFFTTAGGKGANQAVAAAKLGASVAMIGRVGDDAWGTELIAGLAAVGVKTDGIAIEPDVHSGVAVITVAESGENQILGVYGANDRLDDSDVARLKTRLVGAKVLLLQLEVPVKAVQQAAQVAHEMGVTVVLDPAPVREESMIACYPFVDFLVPNETEASQLVGVEVRDVETAMQASLVFHRQGLKKVIIKLGAKGAYYSALRSPLDSTNWESQLETLWLPAFNVKSIDAVAAGDAFAGGFAVALAEGQTDVEAVRWGCAAGALATTKVGAQVAMSDRATFDQFLAGVK
jgi:ribokinase